MSWFAAGSAPYLVWFLALSAACVAVYYRTYVGTSVAVNGEFRAFQRLFLAVYLTMIMADWLQGPYVYALYRDYGFSKGDIGILFIVGFGSSLVFGTVVGSFADRYGRKLNCLIFAVLYSASCITKHFNSFTILLIGRLLGGISTSILFSAFETWMVHEHRDARFPDDWLSSTFSAMTFGSSFVAIVAGLLAGSLASTFGYVAPFDASLLLLVVGAVMIVWYWKENYGEHGVAGGTSSGSSAGNSGGESGLVGVLQSFRKTLQLLMSNERVLLLGLIQSCFESAMYIFVFMWTPVLEDSLRQPLAVVAGTGGASVSLPHGIVFAIFMVAIMAGSKVYSLVLQQRPVEHFSRWVFVIAATSLSAPIFTDNHWVQLAAFTLFELCCGLYFPAVGTMRSKYIPEEVRSTVMNVFRMGLNAIVVITLLNIDTLATDTVFLFTVLLLTLAVLAQHRLFILTEQNSPAEERSRLGLAPGEGVDNALEGKVDASE